MVTWMVKLAGHEFDLKALSKLYTEPECRVAKDDDGSYYLTSDMFASMAPGGDVDAAAHQMLMYIDALTSIRNLGFEHVTLEGVYYLNADGTKTHPVHLSGVVSESSRLSGELTVTGPDGQPRPSPEPTLARTRLELALRDSKVQASLSLWRGCTPSDAALWIYLYKIYEIIGAEMAGGDKNKIKQAIKSCGWATSAELENFGEAANNPEVTGVYARHGAGWKTKQGVTPLTVGDAIAFIRRLLNQWLDWKVKQTP